MADVVKALIVRVAWREKKKKKKLNENFPTSIIMVSYLSALASLMLLGLQMCLATQSLESHQRKKRNAQSVNRRSDQVRFVGQEADRWAGIRRVQKHGSSLVAL